MPFEQLARLAREAGRVPAANDNFLDDVDDADTDDTPTGGGICITGASLARTAQRRTDEREAVYAQLRRLIARQSIGHAWDGRAANDNHDWPLGGVLKREGLKDELAIAERYRKLCRSAHFELVGQDVSEHPLLQRTSFVSGGELRYGRGVAAVKPRGETPPKRANATNDETRQRAKECPRPFNDIGIATAIDAKTILAELRVALGRLVDAVEDAVLASGRFEEIGAGEIGIRDSDKAAGAGRALVLTGLRTLIDAWQRIDERERRLRRTCLSRAERAGFGLVPP
jgi:hypothetical protein